MAASKRVTISDIARLAGVSPGAVSFALNGRPGVSDETRQRILAIAAEHHWRPSPTARALSGSRVDVVGLVVQRPARTIGAEAFFSDLIAGIQEGLSSTRTSMQMRVARDLDDEIETYRLWQGSHQVDGVIVLDPRDDDPRLPLLAEIGLPSVVIGSRPGDAGGRPSVWMDDEDAAHTLFDYIAALGHRRIDYVTGPADFQHTRLRAEVLGSLAERGVASAVHITDFSPQEASASTRRALSARERPTAIVYDNEVMAVAGLRVALEMGIPVPGELSIASFDDSALAELIHPSITSLTRDTVELGRRAAELLLLQIASDATLASVPGPVPALSARESTAPPR